MEKAHLAARDAFGQALGRKASSKTCCKRVQPVWGLKAVHLFRLNVFVPVPGLLRNAFKGWGFLRKGRRGAKKHLLCALFNI
jgi:hypothetical protein